MHSSRMRTVRSSSLGVGPRGCLPRRVSASGPLGCLPLVGVGGGLSAFGSEGVSASGPRGVSALEGVYLWAWGAVYPSMH